MEAVIFCGIQASGKTTFYSQRFAETHVRISLDIVRTRRRERLLMNTCLEAQQPFVVDNPNPTRAKREPYVRAAAAAGFRVVAYNFIATPHEALERNEGRLGRRHIPVPAILRTLRKLEPPRLDEGFDVIYAVTATPDGGFAVSEGVTAA